MPAAGAVRWLPMSLGEPERIVVSAGALEKIAARLAKPGKPGVRLREAAARAAQEFTRRTTKTGPGRE